MVGEEALAAAQWVEGALQLRVVAGHETHVAAAASVTFVALLVLLLWELCAHVRRRCEHLSLQLGASSGRRSNQRARKRPAGVPGTAWHFTGCRSRGGPTDLLLLYALCPCRGVAPPGGSLASGRFTLSGCDAAEWFQRRSGEN